MKLQSLKLAAVLLGSLTLMACGGSDKNVKSPDQAKVGPSTGKPAEINKDAQDKFFAAIETFNGHDKAGDWNDAACADTANRFKQAAAEQKGGKFPEATFNAGLAWQRCGNDK